MSRCSVSGDEISEKECRRCELNGGDYFFFQCNASEVGNEDEADDHPVTYCDGCGAVYSEMCHCTDPPTVYMG